METNETQQTNQTQPPQPETKALITLGERGVQLRDLDGLWRFATMVSRSGLAPKGLEKPEAICVALQMGMEVGLGPMASLQNIAVINNRPCIWGDAQLGVCRATGEMTDFAEWYEVAGKRVDKTPQTFSDDVTAVCRVQRRGYKEPTIGSFSVADAKRAGLWGKQGPWSQYPSRMLKLRPRSFARRDQFGDALRGLRSVEEMRDQPAIDVETVTVGVPANAMDIPTPATSLAEPDLRSAAAAPDASDGSAAVSTAKTPQQELEAFVVETCESDLDRFNAVAVENGHLMGPAPTWLEVPTAVAKRLLRARQGLAGMLRVEEGGAE
jgi:hypothetical protein